MRLVYSRYLSHLGVVALLAAALVLSGCPGDECGNGAIDEGETCDDGNTDDGDGCDSTCQSEPFCGDGNLDTGEECDDGNTDDGDGCDSACEREPGTCGDGVVNDGEACDDGGESAMCNDDCTVAACGDGILNAMAGEDCDDGGETATCDIDCSAPACGDGILNVTAGEECDDGNTATGDGCDDLCVIEPMCPTDPACVGANEGDATCSFNQLDICTDLDGDGCLDLDSTACGIDLCDDMAAPPVCAANPGSGSCASAIVVPSSHFVVAGADFTADFTDDIEMTDASCDDGAASAAVDAIFAVDVMIGDIVWVREFGSMDSVVNIISGACGAAAVCDASNDDPDSGGASFTATAAGTIYIVVEPWSGTPSSTGYDIQIDINPACGNGAAEAGEQCDDGNTTDADGCSATCTVEFGYTCDPLVVPGLCTQFPSKGTFAATDAIPDSTGGPITAGDSEFWLITFTDDVLLSGTLTLGTTGDPDFFLYDASGLLWFENAVGDEAFMDIGLAAGTYLLEVYAFGSTDLDSYILALSTTALVCGDGVYEPPAEACDDGNTATGDGCDASCQVEAGWTCDTSSDPSVCVATCGDGTFDDTIGEECDDGNVATGDRCDDVCLLESTFTEVEPNDTAALADAILDGDWVRGAIGAAGDVDVYTFTLTAPSEVTLEIYATVDAGGFYSGGGSIPEAIDCPGADTQMRVFNSAGDVTMDATALIFDDDDGDFFCSFIATINDPEAYLQPDTYYVKINEWGNDDPIGVYIMDVQITPAEALLPEDLVINEYMANDNVADANCDGVTTGTDDEFVELVNVSGVFLDLTGATISDVFGLRHTFGATGLVDGAAIVVFSGGTPSCASGAIEETASSGMLGLNNGGDTITVADSGAVTIVEHTWVASTAMVSANLDPDLNDTVAGVMCGPYVVHNTVASAVGDYSPGTMVDGTAF